MGNNAATGFKTIGFTLLVVVGMISTLGAIGSIQNPGSGVGVAFVPRGDVFDLEVVMLIGSLVVLTLGVWLGALHFRRHRREV